VMGGSPSIWGFWLWQWMRKGKEEEQ